MPGLGLSECVREKSACVVAGTAMSAGSGARPGKPKCDRRCRVLAWAGRGAWGQPALEGRRGEACNLGPAALCVPAAPSLGAL